jgi:hypothetical protein
VGADIALPLAMEASEATSCLELGLQTSFAPVQHGPRFGEVAQPSHLHAPPFAASVIHDDKAGLVRAAADTEMVIKRGSSFKPP